ncbi:MAG: GDP-mannose 4,6-dehydratase [Gemmatimonadota bacterium]
MRIFLTGIEGFAGRHLSAFLVAEGHEVVGSSLEPGEVIDGVERVWSCDVKNPDRVEAVIAEAGPDALVHLAGQTSVAAAFRRPGETFAVNALGTLHVLEACRQAGVERVLVVTSSEVYGRRSAADGPVPETAPPAPVSPYGASKAAQDLIGAQYWRGYDLQVVRVRAFPHTGPGQDPRFVFPSVARRIARAESGRGPAVIEIGNLEPTRDVSHVRDVVEAYALLLVQGAAGEAYNVCSGVGRTIGEALEVLASLSKVEIEFEVDPARLRPAEVPWMVGDPGLARETIGWTATHRWEETARDLLDNWRERVARESEPRARHETES